MPKVVLDNLESSKASSIISSVNANNDTIETAFENTLSRNGASPNSMEAELDMNSNRIYNLPIALSDTEPVRKAEFDVLVTEGAAGVLMAEHLAAVDPHTQYVTDSVLATHVADTNAHPQYATKVGNSFYDVQQNHGLLGNSGDGVKIQAAHDAAPIGATLIYPTVTSPVTTTLNFTRNLNHHFHGSIFNFSMVDNNTDGINYSPTNTEGFDGARNQDFDGLSYFFSGLGRHGINITSGVGGVAIQNTFRHLSGGPGANPIGFALRSGGEGPHWNTFDECFFGPRGVLDESADGNVYNRCGFYGNIGIYFNKVLGAFKSRVSGGFFAMGGTAIFIKQGESIEIDDGVSFEHGSVFAPFIAPYDGVTSLNFGATIVMYALGGTAMRFNSIKNCNFGGGVNVTNHLYLAGVDAAQGVYHTVFDDNVLNICGSGGAVTADINIINQHVYFFDFGSRNKPRGDRSVLVDPNNTPFLINDNGTGSYGLWRYIPTPQNGWAQSSAGAYRKTQGDVVEWRGGMIAGTKTANTLITTLPDWYRPAEDFYDDSIGVVSGLSSPIKFGLNGEVSVGPLAMNATDTQLYMNGKSYAVIGKPSTSVGL